jgi:predicted dehydrogenase
MPEQIRAAIIGCGPSTPGKGGAHSIAYAHGWGLSRVPEVKIVAAASRNALNAADYCAEFAGAKDYTDYREMLRAEKPDLVSVCAFPRDREAMVTETKLVFSAQLRQRETISINSLR